MWVRGSPTKACRLECFVKCVLCADVRKGMWAPAMSHGEPCCCAATLPLTCEQHVTLERGCAAPEIISNLHIKDATKIDIWSAGVMLYVMLFCCYPFERPDDCKDQGDQQKYQRVGCTCSH